MATAVLIHAATPATISGEPTILPGTQAVTSTRDGGEAKLLREIAGPLPAVAAAPFFSLAVLYGVAWASDSDVARQSDSPMIQQIRDNEMVREARRRTSGPLLFGLLLLALFSYFGNSGKLQGAIGKPLRLAEGCVATLVYTALAGAASTRHPDAASGVGTMAIGVGFAGTTVLIVAAVLACLTSLMVVRLAFDVLVWLTPIPFVDLLFETAKTIATVLLLGLYFFSPVTAFVCSLLMAAAAILLFRWSIRLVRFAFVIVLRPLFAKMFPGLQSRLVDANLCRDFELDTSRCTVATRCAALNVPGARRRAVGVLVVDADGVSFLHRDRLGRRVRRPVPRGKDDRVRVARGVTFLDLSVTSATHSACRIALPRTLLPQFAEFTSALGAEDVGAKGVARLFEAPASHAPALT